MPSASLGTGFFFFLLILLLHLFSSSSSSSSSVCLAGGIPPDALKPTEAYCANPAFGPPFISRGAPRQTASETSISERRNYGREMADQI
jgi:hypothetical protein